MAKYQTAIREARLRASYNTGMNNYLSRYKNASFGTLDKACFIELFFDLVFVFCMRTIIPVSISGAEDEVSWYSYYTFVFTYVVMLQVWYKTTTLMNRFGTGGALDIACLVVNMFLLMNMAYAISTGWERFTLYNVSWILVDVNLIVHWCLRLYLTRGENPALERFGKRVVVFLAVQAALVLLSFAFPSVPAQVICLVAMLVGFASFASRLEKQIGKSHRSHLVERCALLIVLAFGEVVIGIGNSHEEGYSLLDAAFLLLLALGLFLVYLNQIENIVDEDKLGNGFAYIAVNAWLTFCIGNMTAAFEITNEGLSIGPLSGQAFMVIWVSAFLLSLFLFLPFSREFGDVHKRWIAARTAACVGVALVTLIVGNTPLAAIYETENSDGMADMPLYVLFYLVMLLGLLLVYLVLFIDKKMLGGHSQQSPTPNAK